MQALADYLREEAARPFARGAADCVSLITNWVALRRGIDPMEPWRGYSTDAEADAILARYGGLVKLLTVGLGMAGLEQVEAPRLGDVAMIAPDNLTRACAIRSGKGWVVRLREGLALYPPEQVRLLRAWRV